MDRDQMTQVRARRIEATISVEGEMSNRLLLVLLIACGCDSAPKTQFQAQFDMAVADLQGPALDMADVPDLAAAIDMSRAADMSEPADLATAPPDMTCGVAVGSPCCITQTMPPACAYRDPLDQLQVCHNGTCVHCGTRMMICCAGNLCGGGLTCAGPGSAFEGLLERAAGGWIRGEATFDAQNLYAAMVRNHVHVICQRRDGQVFFNREYGVQDLGPQAPAQLLATFKELNGWPVRTGPPSAQ